MRLLWITPSAASCRIVCSPLRSRSTRQTPSRSPPRCDNAPRNSGSRAGYSRCNLCQGSINYPTRILSHDKSTTLGFIPNGLTLSLKCCLHAGCCRHRHRDMMRAVSSHHVEVLYGRTRSLGYQSRQDEWISGASGFVAQNDWKTQWSLAPRF